MNITRVMKVLVICVLTALVFSCAGQRSVPEAIPPEKPAPVIPPSKEPVPATPPSEKPAPVIPPSKKPVPVIPPAERPVPADPSPERPPLMIPPFEKSVPAGPPPEKSAPVIPPREKAVPEIPPPEKPVPVIPPPERFETPEYIMGKGRVPEEKLALFLRQNNPEADRSFVLALAGYYIDEAAAEGVNHDTAFAQMCLETGFLNYGGLVTPDMNNFCGLGSTGPGQPGEKFPNPQTGVRAHIQHLKAYATDEPLNGTLVDPRYWLVKYGSSPTIHGLSGTWAADKNYSTKIGVILQRLYDFSFTPALAVQVKGQ